jgi:hypothetical protein
MRPTSDRSTPRATSTTGEPPEKALAIAYIARGVMRVSLAIA